MTDNPPIRIYVNKIENKTTFRITTGYYLQPLIHETMKLLETTKKIAKDQNGENVTCLKITEVVLVNCDIANNDYQQDSRVLYTFIPNKSFDQVFNISPKNFIFLKTFNSEFPYIEVLFTDQNSKPLKIKIK